MPQLDALHMSHLTYVQISDPAMPGEPGLINTSVGTSTYSNCGNESCMINQELDQRGLEGDARRRLEVWLKYQGTEPLIGRFSDKEGVLHGAGSFSFLASYNQNHGWILWRLAEHYLYTRDRAWLDHAESGDPRRVRLGVPPAQAHDEGATLLARLGIRFPAGRSTRGCRRVPLLADDQHDDLARGRHGRKGT